MQQITVQLDERSYNILIGEGLLQSIATHLADIVKLQQKLFVVTDSTVASLYLAPLMSALTEAGYMAEAVVLDPGEQSKSFATLETLLDAILQHQPDRKSTLIALGGGVIGDLTGFAASILLRGVPFIQIPTTLLSQVDSSVGGKTGINTRFGKNLIGSFYQPKLVLADTGALSSLPMQELLAGYAEVVKYGLINNAPFFDWLETNAAAIQARDNSFITECVKISCESKAAIVEADEREGGIRALLNLGHTFGHALEAETGFSSRLLHGEAVAIGMVLAFRLSVQLGLCDEEELTRVITHLQKVGLPTSPFDIQAEWNMDALISHMYQDKKTEGGKLVFILARAIGEAFIAKDVEEQQVRTMLASMVPSPSWKERCDKKTDMKSTYRS